MLNLRSAVSSLWKTEDWWAVWLGLLILGVFASGIARWLPKIGIWTVNPGMSVSAVDLAYLLVLGLALLALTSAPVIATKANIRVYWKGFPVVFLLSVLAFIIASQQAIKTQYGLEYPIWALAFGLVVSNIVGVPKWLRGATRTELFVKIGLVLLGAEIIFQTILKAGVSGMAQALLVVVLVWYFCYLLAVKMGLDKSFAAILSSGVSICGVSAAIAAGGAIKGDQKKVSYAISLILLVAIPMLIGEPIVARWLNLPSAVAGAWIGGTIDTTPAVIAAGALYSENAMTYAAIVKLSQNVLIGVAAFLLALYWTMKVDKRNPGKDRPSKLEIWYRFPKFILGFILASLVFSLLLTPWMGEKSVSSITGLTSTLRGWFFSMAFVSVGLDTKFSELIKIGAGKPALVFVTAQVFNILLTFIIAWLLFGGVLL